MTSVSSGKWPPVVKKNKDETVEVVVHGAIIGKGLRARGPGVSRYEAATAIAMVAQACANGFWPKVITPRMLGRALRCAVSNARRNVSSEVLFAEVMAGFADAGGNSRGN